VFCFFFSSRRRHTRFSRDWSSDVCSSDLAKPPAEAHAGFPPAPPPVPPANWSDRGGSRARKAWSWIRPLCRTRIAFPETRVFGRSAPCALLQGILGLFLPTKERKHVRSFRTGGAGHRRRSGHRQGHRVG